MIDQTNSASQRLAGRLGFIEFAKVVYRKNQVLLFERQNNVSTIIATKSEISGPAATVLRIKGKEPEAERRT